MGIAVYILYVVAALMAAGLLAKKTDRKILSFILIFWLFAQPVLNTVLLIHTPGLGFDFQPNRILLIALLLYMFFVGMLGLGAQSRSGAIRRPPFEKYIYIYLMLIFASLVFNFSYIRAQTVATVPLEILTFVLLYLVAKKYVTESVFEAIISAIILMAVVSAVIALVQIGIDSSFLKTGDPRRAFGNVVRSSATFQAEYELGYFQILAIMVAMVRFKGSLWRYPLIALFAASLFVTFHRLDILILLVCLSTYGLISGKGGQKIASLVAMIFIIILVVLSYLALESVIGNTAFVKERVKEDTVSGRLEQYKVIIQSLPDFPFGMGDYTSKAYYDLMNKNQMMETIYAGTADWTRRPYQVHNGYLEVGALYGGVAMVIYMLLLFSMLGYFKKRVSMGFPYSIVPFYAVFIWVLSNISNPVSAMRMYFVLLMAMLCGSFLAIQRYPAVMEIKDQRSTTSPSI